MQAEWKCYASGEKGHLPNSCYNPRPHPNQPSTSTHVLTRGDNSIPVAAKQNYACGRVNHVTMEEAEEASDIVIDMFF
jgi:hypothetical protein